jgi:ABC-type antimicrobial peptide transport system permease subunit
MAKSYSMVKTELLKNPAIEHISVVTDTPLYIGSIVVSGEWEGRNPNTNPQLTFFGVDHDFLATFDIDLVQGRFFGPNILPQSREVVINETLATLVGKKDVVGSQITSLDRTFNIIGVVKDFNFRPLDQYLEPLVMFHDDQIMPFRYMFVKVRPDGISRTIASLKDAGNRFKLDAPLEYKFLDEEAAAQYEAEERLRGLVSAFMALAIFISSLGLFGLSVFMVERRVREIGIRKILGASAFRVTALLSMNILKWVLVANAIAWPVGYLFMSRWLRNFAFHIDLNFWIFALSAGILFVIGLGTVSVQTLRAASANPARSLRHE